MSKPLLREIPLSRVRWTDRSCCFRFNLQTDDLYRSVRKNGLLSPPGVMLHKGHYRIIYGFRRVAATRKLKVRSLTAALYPENLTGQQLADLIVADNHWPGTHPLDLAGFYQLVRKLTTVSDKEFIQRYSSRLGVPRTLKYLQFLNGIGTLPLKIKKAFYAGKVGTDKAEVLVLLKPADQLVLYQAVIARGVETSKSVFFQIAEILRDLKVRDRRSIKSIVSGRTVRPVLNNKKLTARQKGDQLLHNLRVLRYPRLMERLRELDRVKAGLLKGLPSSVRLSFSPYLEETGITLSVRAADPNDLQEAMDRINDQFRGTQWQDLFRVVKGS